LTPSASDEVRVGALPRFPIDWLRRMVARKRVVVHGRVQGVFFRDTTRRAAQSRGVSGWVRNTPEGSVEAVFEGDSDAVDAMVRFAHEGPRGATVEKVEVADEEPEGLSGFQIR
jgi:acylphosphatase